MNLDIVVSLIICLGSFMMKINGIDFKVGDIFHIKYKNNLIYYRYVIKQIRDEDVEISAILDTRKEMYNNLKTAKSRNPDSHFFKNMDLESEENYSFFVGEEFFKKGKVMKERYYEMTYTLNNRRYRRIFCSMYKSTKEKDYKFMKDIATSYLYNNYKIYDISSERLSFLRKNGLSIKYII